MEKAIRKYWPVFVLPTLGAFLIGFVWPFIQGLYLSFCKFITIDRASFNGLKNYIFALTEADFLHAFWFTALFTVVSIVCINVAALAIALALTREIKGTNLFRSVYFMPNLIGGIVLGYIWNILLNCALTLLGKPEDYRIRLDKGLGEARLDGQKMYDDAVYGNGIHSIEIDGGVGELKIEFTD